MSYNIRQQNAERRLRHSRWARDPGLSFGGLCVVIAVSIFLGFAIAAQF